MSLSRALGHESIGQLFTGGLIPPRILVDPHDTILTTGLLLTVRDNSCAVVRERGKVKGVLYGYQIVSLITLSKPEEIYSILWRSIAEVDEIAPLASLPTVTLGETIDGALAKISAARFGDLLVVDDKGAPAGLLTLGMILKAVAGRAEKVGLTVGDAASPLKLVDPKDSVIDVMRFMMRNRVRRVVMQRGSKLVGCTERELLKACFSTKGLEMIRDDLESFLATPIGSFAGTFLYPIPNVNGSVDVAKAWTLASVVRDDVATLIVDETKIATPWDLIVKPYLAGVLPLPHKLRAV